VNASSGLPDGASVARVNAVTPGFNPRFHFAHTQKSPSGRMGFFTI